MKVSKHATEETMRLFREDGIVLEDVIYTIKMASEISGKTSDTLVKNAKKGRLVIKRNSAGRPRILGQDLIDFISIS